MAKKDTYNGLPMSKGEGMPPAITNPSKKAPVKKISPAKPKMKKGKSKSMAVPKTPSRPQIKKAVGSVFGSYA